MARVCCVESCRAVPHEDITFFNFPIKQSLQKRWKDAIRPTAPLTSDSLICSRHFAAEDYETVRGKVRLKGKVVPTIFDHTDSPNSPENKENPKENGHSDSTNIENSLNTERSPNSENCNNSENSNNSENFNKSENSNNSENSRNLENSPNPENSPITEKTVNGEEANNETESVNKIQDTSKNNEGESGVEGGLEEDGLEDSHEEYEMPVELSCEVQLNEGEENETIECVPEAIIHEDSDSHSETDIHKEDIEDIIANYHIKQDPKLAERLKASHEKENLSNNKDNKSEERVSDKECNNSDKECNNSVKECNNSDKDNKNSGKRDSLPPDKDDNDCVEVSYQPARKRRRPEYIEIPVAKDPADKSNDCLMVMENVEVNIDPSTLLFTQGDPGDDGDDDDDDSDSDVQETEVTQTDTKRKTDPISLLTSSDDDDVIIEEPRIDTVEVSDETDEDDVPLKRLLKSVKSNSSNVKKILWGNLHEYYCYKCRHTCTSSAEYTQHKATHEKIFDVCDVCGFSTVSKAQFIRHKRKHKDSKHFNCQLCDYKAKHHMSLIYHLKSHGDKMTSEKTKIKCPNCDYFTNNSSQFSKHYEACQAKKSNMKHKCTKCKYKTRRPSDLQRHVIKKHLRKRKRACDDDEDSDDDDDDEDFEP